MKTSGAATAAVNGVLKFKTGPTSLSYCQQESQLV